MTDFRDLAIETYGDENAALRERIGSLEQDVQCYRDLAQQAIHSLHAMTVQRDRLTARLRHLLDELRALREAERRAA